MNLAKIAVTWLLGGAGAFAAAAANAQAAVAKPSAPSTEEERAAMLRVVEQHLASADPGLRAAALGMVLDARLRLSPASVDKLLRDAAPDIRAGIGAYPFLSDAQLQFLLGTRDANALKGLLIRHDKNPLTPSVITAMVAANVVEIDRRLANKARITLSPADVAALAARGDPLTGLLLAQGYGVGSVQAQMTALLKSASADDINAGLGAMPVVPEGIVDALLVGAPPPVRRYLLMQGRFTPTPAQVALVLRETDPEVLIGLLRRKDIDLPAAVVNDGALTADDTSGFWFRQRKEFRPDAQQIEQGLSSRNTMTRRGFVSSPAVTLTAAQVERALTDPDEIVRSQVLARKNMVLTDVQLDRCLFDSHFANRYGCIQRPEFKLDQRRFETLLQDSNPNLLDFFRNPKRVPSIDLSAFVWATLRTGSPTARIALTKHRAIALDNVQIDAGLQADEPDVVAAFDEAWRRYARKR